MNISFAVRWVFGILVAATLSGCGGSQSIGGVSGLQMPTTRSTSLSTNAVASSRLKRDSKVPGTLKYYSATPALGSFVADLLLGPDGGLWYPTQETGDPYFGGAISDFTTTGETQYDLGYGCGSCPFEPEPTLLTNGPDGRVWFGIYSRPWGWVGALSTNGNLQYYNGLPGEANAVGAVSGENIWFTAVEANASQEGLDVGYIDTTTGAVTSFVAGGDSPYPTQIIQGPDGNFWFADWDYIGRVTPSGTVALFDLAQGSKFPGQYALFIISGPDGDLWFSTANGSIGKMNTSGKILSEINNLGQGQQLAVGPNNKVWVATTSAIWEVVNKKKAELIKPSGPYEECAPLGLAMGANHKLWFSSFAAGNASSNCSYGIGTVIPKK